ncbi:MAG TPA: hypothetical protein VEL76_13285 [Gemmataceae bacterium]|nr:hypothetical protein [Gemmataceae bacterium]
MVSLKRKVEQLEAATGGNRPVEDRCPQCRGTDLTEPGEEELCTVEDWTQQEVAQVCHELIHRARIDWCRTCKRLVAVGEPDPSWRAGFENGQENAGLARHIADVSFLRAVYRSHLPWARDKSCAPEQ